MGSLKGFNFYWNTRDNRNGLITMQPSFKTEKDKWIEHMKNSIDTGEVLNDSFETFIERNLDLDIWLTLRRSYQKEDQKRPKITLMNMNVNAIEFVFRRLQYKTILEIVDYYSMLNVHKRYVKYRPLELDSNRIASDSLSNQQIYKLWWNYIFTCFAETTRRSYRKDRINIHWKSYKEYIQKYEQKLRLEKANKTLNEKDVKDLERLEKVLTLESILDARDLVKNKLQPEDKTIGKKEVTTTELTKFGDRPKGYVEFRLVINLPLISIKLINAGFQILQINFKGIESKFETKPNADSVYFLLNTRGM
jgi:hypothetical protein